MADIPSNTGRLPQVIMTNGPEFAHWGFVVQRLLAAPTSTAFPAANRGIWLAFTLQYPVLVRRLFIINGATAAGNTDMGIYDWGLNRLVSIGPTAQSGTNAAQFFNVTDTPIGPGRYYLAVVNSNGTATAFAQAPGAAAMKACGSFQQASVGTLPATATPATIATSFVPVGGLEIARVS